MNRTVTISQVFVPPQLGPKQAHAWYVDLERLPADVSQWESLLSDEERQRAARFRFPRDQRRFMLTRALLRVLLASYLGTEPQGLSFRAMDHGKPILTGQHDGNSLQFNVSHSDGVALYGLALDRIIGVDVERIRYDFEVAPIAQRFFSEAEQRVFASLPKEQQHRAFFDCWTRKEAYVKARGEGLSHPLHQFDVSLAPGEPARILATRPDPAEAANWTMAALEVHAEYTAAVAVKEQSMEIKCEVLKRLV